MGKAIWILKKIEENNKITPDIIKPTFEDNSTLPYLGKNYSLTLKKSDKNRLIFSKKGFTIFYSKKSPKEIYMKWLKRKAGQLVQPKIKNFSEIIGVKPSKLEVKELKSKWGSITPDGNVIINVNILKTPIEVIDYVLIHELCHMLIDNHSKSFWNLLSTYIPNYQSKIKWLEINSNNVL